jgi:hypothetical protein
VALLGNRARAAQKHVGWLQVWNLCTEEFPNNKTTVGICHFRTIKVDPHQWRVSSVSVPSVQCAIYAWMFLFKIHGTTFLCRTPHGRHRYGTDTSLIQNWHVTDTELTRHWYGTDTSLIRNWHVTDTELTRHWYVTDKWESTLKWDVTA